ncbi:unnamed protein product [Camellia sinensis]
MRFSAADELAGGDAENRADPLAAGEERVSHGFVDRWWISQHNSVVEGFVDGISFEKHVSIDIELGGDLLIRTVCFFFGENRRNCGR